MFRLKPRTSIVNEGPEYSVIPGRSPPAGSLISNLRSLARSMLSASPAWIMISQAGAVQGTNRYAYVGNNPLVRSDPSGLRYEKDGGGGGGAPPPPSSPVPPSPGAPPKWQSIGCLVNDAAFIIGVILSLLGLPSDVSAEEAVVLQIVNLVGVDFILGAVGMLVGGTDVLSGIVAITQLIFDFAQIVLQDLLPRMIQGFFMWLAVTTNFALTFVPGELGVKLILMAYSIGLGLEGLAAGGCL